MAVANFIPEIWSAKLLTALSTNLVAEGICNRDYEGDATGDAVNITSVADPTIGTYTPHSDITVEDIDDATRQLLLNQYKYFAFELDDVERAQSVNGGSLMAETTTRAAYGLAKTIDTYVLSAIGTGASASAPDHQIAEATISTASDAYEALVDWAVLLDGSDVPEQSRWAVITPAFHGLLLKDDRFVSAGDAAGAATRTNGMVGSAAGFTIHKSNNLPDGPGAGAGKSMLAGSNISTTLAMQLRKVEAFKQEKRFNDAVKGLVVYGAKVLRSTAIVSADVIVS